MPKQCVIGGCSNVAAPGVPMHSWPRDGKLARKWDRFARIKRADWNKGVPGVSNICWAHFLPTDYDSYLQWKAGVVSRLCLNKDAVPSVHAGVSGAPTAVRDRSQSRAAHVMEINRLLAPTVTKRIDGPRTSMASHTDIIEPTPPVIPDANLCDQAVPSSGRKRKLLRTKEPKKKSVGTQYKIIRADPQLKRSFGTQVSWTRRLTRSQGTQISVLSVSVGISTPFQWKRPPPIQSSTFRKPFLPFKRRQLKLDDDESTLSQASSSINDVLKYVVDEDCLLQLFEECPVCGSMCEVQKTTIESLLTIDQLCPQCQFNRNWRSQQTEKPSPSGDDRSCTSDPESSAAITAIIGFSDENDSSDEGQSSELDAGDCNSDSDWDPMEHHSGDSKLAGSESDADGRCDEDFRQLCPECGKYFYNQKTHTCENKKAYSCNLCGKRFVSEVYLKAHNKTHEEGYKHVCKYCCSTFRMRSDKLAHEQRHPPRKKPYQCPDCPLVFAKIQKRREHLLTHRGPKRHICHICSMEFFAPGSLDRHMIVHTKAKQFVCEVCQHSFTQSNHLKSHLRVHTGEKPYQCQHCDKSFNHNVSLKSHIQRYHGQVPDPGMKVQIEKTSTNVSEVEKDETNEMESCGVDTEGAETDEMESSGVDADEAEPSNTLWSPDEKLQKVQKRRKKYKYKSTGRPRGRPKKNTLITLDDANQLKRPLCISDENEKGQGNSTDEEQEHDGNQILNL